MKINKRLTVIMKKKYKKLKTKKGCHHEERRQVDTIFNLQIFVDQSQDLEVEACNSNISHS